MAERALLAPDIGPTVRTDIARAEHNHAAEACVLKAAEEPRLKLPNLRGVVHPEHLVV